MGFQPDGGGSAVTQTLKEASVTLSEAQILALNSTPITVAASPGVGKYIEVISASAVIETYSGTPYATNTQLDLIMAGATLRQFACVGLLSATIAKKGLFTGTSGGGATDVQIIPNAALQVKAATGNPTNAGTGSVVKVKVLYREVTI